MPIILWALGVPISLIILALCLACSKAAAAAADPSA